MASQRSPTVERQLASIAPGDHLCLLHASAAEQLAAETAFVRSGLLRGERCVVVVDDPSADHVLHALGRGGVDTTAERGRGALRILGRRATYLRHGHFDAHQVLAFLREQTESAGRDGFPNLRFTGDMSWALDADVPHAELVEYEALLSEFLPAAAATGLCHYHRGRVPSRLLHDVLRTHPLVVLGDDVCPNPFFEPPELVLGRRPGRLRIDWRLQQLRAAGRTEQELYRLQQAGAERIRALRRERRARTAAEQRAREQEALRRAAEIVNASDRIDEVLLRVAECALQACGADISVVTRVDRERGEVEVVAGAGEFIVPVGYRLPYEDSLTSGAIEAGGPLTIPRLCDIGETGLPLPRILLDRCGDCSALVVPLSGGDAAAGALLLLRRPDLSPAGDEDVDRARTFGTLASLAFRKAHLLEEANRRRAELEHVVEVRERLIRGFSHDLKNPLGAADAYLQLLELEVTGPVADDQRTSLLRARRAIGTALCLIDNLVELARADAGHIDIRRESVDIRELAGEVADEYRAIALAKGLTLEVELPPTLPVIESDVARIRQILGNLLSNAVKYTAPDGRVRVTAAVRPGRRAHDAARWISIGVSDTGTGIPPEQQPLLFQEFVRLEPGDTDGAGLGLAISDRLAHALGGEITVDSVPGRGSTFELWLPFEPDDSAGGKAAAA